jgi:hypothetical protein
LVVATPEKTRALFLDYIKTANELHKRPQWYNELMSNCTSNIRLHIKRIGSARPWDWQLLVNGTIDERAYELEAIDTSLLLRNSSAAVTLTTAPAQPIEIRLFRTGSGMDCPEWGTGSRGSSSCGFRWGLIRFCNGFRRFGGRDFVFLGFSVRDFLD